MNRAVHRLRTIADVFPECERPELAPPATPAAMERLTEVSGGCLPEEFRGFLLLTDGIIAMGIRNGYWIGGTATLVRSIARGDPPREIIGAAVIPVAGDGGGNCFLMSPCRKHVWRWDHETGSVKKVAGSFRAFLDRVADDWEQFAANNQSWKYLV